MGSAFKIIRRNVPEQRQHDENVHFVPKNWTRIEEPPIDNENHSFRTKQKSAPSRCPLCGTESSVKDPTILRDCGKWKCTICGNLWN